MSARRIALVSATLVLVTALAAPRAASAQASLYVPLDDIAYQYTDALMARGEMRGLSLLERPYTARQLAAEADSALAHNHSAVVKSYAIALRTALQRYATDSTGATTASSDSPKFFGNADLYATAETSGERELMQADSDRSVTGGFGFRLAMVAGPFAAILHPIIDNSLNHDPDFAGRKDRAIAGRTQDAYVSGQWDYFDLFLGRIARNWGPYSLQGLQLGSAPYTYDHLYIRAGTDAVHLSALAAKLDDAFEPSGVYARYFYTHRLGVRWRGLEAAASEGYIATGIGRSWDLSLLNPTNIYALSWRNERVQGHLTLGGDLGLRTSRFGNYTGEVLLGNRQIDACGTLNCQEPASYGISAAAEGIPLIGDNKLFASYSRLSALAYRSKDLAGQYSILGVGLGQPFSDYDELRAGVDLAAVPYTTLRVYGAFRRQGQGDYRLPFPPDTAFPVTAGFLQGIAEHIARAAVSGATTIAPGLELTADVGFNHETNAAHLTGITQTRFVARAQLKWTTRSLTF